MTQVIIVSIIPSCNNFFFFFQQHHCTRPVTERIRQKQLLARTEIRVQCLVLGLMHNNGNMLYNKYISSVIILYSIYRQHDII